MEPEIIVCPKCGAARPASIRECSICPPERRLLVPAKKGSATGWLVVAILGCVAALMATSGIEDGTGLIVALLLICSGACLVMFFVKRRK